jgi:hypothetical protein
MGKQTTQRANLLVSSGSDFEFFLEEFSDFLGAAPVLAGAESMLQLVSLPEIS